ncbi:hypothetical protein BJF79_39625 [Actinomadura sp. CNU-125]|nr:hypothetical protein BJF79_39625 [Actinomadura sp. CNU-125]
MAGEHVLSTDGGSIAADPDATIVLAPLEEENAVPAWNGTFGFNPMTVVIDHGPGGAGEVGALDLRPGNASSNTADDQNTTVRAAFQQIPAHLHKPC